MRRARANKRVFAIGNGESRKDLNLGELYEFGIIYGCNALYRDFQPDALVVVDPKMKEEIRKTDYLLKNKVYFKEEHDVISRKFPDDVFRWGYASGPTSVLIACIEEEPDEVYLIGHDLQSPNEYFNNVYKDTENYLESNTPPCPPDNWITQLKWCFNDFKTIQFYKVSSLMKVNEWDEIENIHYITFDEMWKRLNR
tara:strand:+ start:74 stop:664 length:591 start_codon:yes stop_codon:yes gene_type:complete